MEAKEMLEKVREMFTDKEWFVNVSFDSFNRLIIQVSQMNLEILSSLPSTIFDQNYLVHFASHYECDRTKFVTNLSKVIYDKTFLVKELDRLEHLCGHKRLENIFYESHDKNNAITFDSLKFPDVRESIDFLYNKFGFDQLYDEI